MNLKLFRQWIANPTIAGTRLQLLLSGPFLLLATVIVALMLEGINDTLVMILALIGVVGIGRQMTALHRVKAERQQIEQQYQMLFREMLDGFALHELILDAQGQPADYRFLAVNPAFECLTGLKAEALVGRTVLEALPGTEQHWIDTYGRVALTGEPALFENHSQDLGRSFKVTAFRPAPGQFACIFSDITERKQAEAQANALQDYLRCVLDSLPSHIAILDHQGLILDVNEAWKDFADNNALAVAHYCIGQNYLAICEAATESEKTATGIRAVINRQIDNFSLEYPCHAPDEQRWFLLRVTPFMGSGPASVILTHTDITDRKQVEEQITHLAYHDALTQLPNRVLLTDRLQQAMAQVQRDQQQLAVCYLDLDDFKPINDALGSVEGDRVLIEVAQRLKTCVRAGDTVARMGGDEFVLLLGDLPNIEECERALDRVLTVLQTPFPVAGLSLSLTASLGVTLYPDDAADPDALLRHTDQAMYAAKQAGGHRYHWFDADHDRRARLHRELLQQVEAGLVAGEFRLYYQPKVDMRTGAVIGAEALIRWQHPDEGLLPPARFMPAVETSDLAITLDCWVIQEALRQMTVWAAQGLHLRVSVNVCGRHLQQLDFVARLRTVLVRYPTIPRDGLELEILETAALDDMAAISRLIEACRQLGVRFALDDFGTGYSSLTYLQHLPVQILKIDQSFVRNLLADADARAIVEGVIGLSAAFRREVIAEGVETDAHGSRLMQLGCMLAQGYGIARPMPPELIPGWIAAWTPPDAWANAAGVG